MPDEDVRSVFMEPAEVRKTLSQDRPRLGYISLAYFIGVLLVLFGHSHPLGDTYYPALVNDIIRFIYIFHMPLFFFISGVLFSYTKGIEKYGYWRWIKKKIITLLIPYLVLSLIAIIPKYFISAFVTDTVRLDFFSILKMIFSPRDGVWGHFWFIPTLLGISAIAGAVQIINNKYLNLVILIGSLLLNILPVKTNWFALNDISTGLFYYFAGMLFCPILNKYRKQTTLLICFLITISISIALFMLNNRLDVILVNRVICWLMIINVFSIGFMFEKHSGNRLIATVNKYILTIYIYSWIFQAVAEIITNKLLHLEWFLIFPIMFFVGISMPLLMITIYDKMKFKNKFISIVLGYRY